jgi:hypothetical protein
MKANNSSVNIESQISQSKLKNRQVIKVIQVLSWIVTAIFLIALAWAIYQAVVNGNPLPVWAWLGIVALFAVAVGLGVMVIVYRGVAKEVGPFDFRPSSHLTGELKREVKHVEAGGASSLQVELDMLSGILQLTGGTPEALEASFTYDDADWQEPELEYAVDAAGLGKLVVEQKGTNRPAMRQGRCEWDVRLSQDLPLELHVKFGAGKADLKLAGLSLSRLQVEGGVGALVLDLSGEWGHSLEAMVRTGIGDTTLRLPQNAGVRLQSMVGFGSTHPAGLAWDGEAYTNAAYGKSPVTLEITVEGGMGKINFEQAG